MVDKIDSHRAASRNRLLSFVVNAEEQLKQHYLALTTRGQPKQTMFPVGPHGVVSALIPRTSLCMHGLPQSLTATRDVKKVIKNAQIMINEILGSQSVMIYDEKAFFHVMADAGNNNGVLIPFSTTDLPRVVRTMILPRNDWIKTMTQQYPNVLTESMMRGAINNVIAYKSLTHLFFYTEESDTFILYDIRLE